MRCRKNEGIFHKDYIYVKMKNAEILFLYSLLMNLIIYLFINGLAVFLASYILPGVHVDSFLTALIVAIVFAILNLIVKPILTLLTLPITIFTLGLFLLVINVIIVFITDKLIDGFSVDNWIWALLFGFIVTIFSSFLSSFTKK